MLTSDLDFFLPPELIAQEPVEPRDASRLLVLHRSGGNVEHRFIRELPALLRTGDLLVFNDTSVLRARIRGRKRDTGGKVEILLLREIELNVWEALLKPSARLRSGMRIDLIPNAESPGALDVAVEILWRTAVGWRVRFDPPVPRLDIRELLPLIGEVPLPPYIRKPPRDEKQYQTHYAQSCPLSGNAEGLDSAAAPTAGLHFTPELLAALRDRGIRMAFVTLGIGVGTFRPIQSEMVEEHVMHSESFFVPQATVEAIAEQRRQGRRVVAVGTTTTRVLESIATPEGKVPAGSGSTSIFIRSGYQFRCVDALLTNFHLPRSTLLAMIAAFTESAPRCGKQDVSLDAGEPRAALTGLEKVRYAYSLAVEQRYRFFSFGDAMFIE